MEIFQLPSEQVFPISLPIRVWAKNSVPGIELRRYIQMSFEDRSEPNNALIRALISCAFHGKPLTIIPTFTDKIKSISSLVQNGLIYYDKDKDKYFYTF